MEAMIYCSIALSLASVGEMMQRASVSERHGVIVIGEGTKREVGWEERKGRFLNFTPGCACKGLCRRCIVWRLVLGQVSNVVYYD